MGTPQHTPGALTSGTSRFERFSPPGPRPSLTWIVIVASPPQGSPDLHSLFSHGPGRACQNSSLIASLLQSTKSRGSQSHNHDLQNPSGNAPAPPLPSSTPTAHVQTAQYRDAKNQKAKWHSRVSENSSEVGVCVSYRVRLLLPPTSTLK